MLPGRYERAHLRFGPAVVVWLSLVGCYGGDGDAADPGPSTAEFALPGCEDGEPDLVDGFTLERDVDYISDRFGETLLSEEGTPCEGAVDMDLCLGALDGAALPFRHLVTTEGGTVRVWESGSAVALFGQVDSVAEAAWMANALDYFVPCDVQVDETFDLFVLDGVEARWGCSTAQAIVTLSVSPEGQVNELRTQFLDRASCEPMGVGGPIPIDF
jgi:hypothetical protein